MHMADALINPATAATMYACSAATVGYSVKKIRNLDEPKKIPMMGIMGAFVFAAQMINFTIPGTGSSGHLCGGMMLSAILGPEAGFLTLVGVLMVQCFMFADGGILALGANIWNMAFYGCFIGGMVIWKNMMKNGMSKKKIGAASIIGCIITLQLGAFSVTLETLASGITELPFSIFVSAMQPIHLAIGLVEGLITTAVLTFLYEARPEILWCYKEDENKKAKLTYKTTLVVLAVTAFVIGGMFSLVASSNPDGLEWSIAKVTGTDEIKTSQKINNKAEEIQNKSAILPDYNFKDSESVAGTSFSGVAGALTVVVICIVACYCLRLFRKKKLKE